AGVTMTDVVTPAVVTLTAPPGCSLGSPQQVTCFIGSMSPSTSVPFTITGTIAPNASGTITNTASAFGTTFDNDTSNNVRSVATQISGSADVQVGKSHAPTFPVAGGPITYTVTVTNTGPSSAQGVVMTDVLPAEVTATGASGCQVTPSQVTCVIGTMAPGTVRQFVITGTVSPDALGVITNTASAFGTTPDTNTNNNTKRDQAFVIRSVALAVTKTHEPQTPTAGQEVTFTIGVTNNGPSRATGVVITDLLPPELTATSASLGCTVTSHLVTCPVGSLEPSKTVEVTVTAMVSPSA